MWYSVHALLLGTLPVALFCTAPVLLVARLRSRPWPWGRAAALAALLSAVAGAAGFAAVLHLFAGGVRLAGCLLAAAGSAVLATLCTALVAGGARLLERAGR